MIWWPPSTANLDAYGLTDSIGADRLFPTLPTAVAADRNGRP